MEQMVNENTNVEQVSEQPKKKQLWKGILFSALVVVAVLMTQVAVSIAGSMVLMVQCMLEVGGDAVAFEEIYMEKALSADFTTNVLCFATAGEVIVVLLWYKLAFVKKYTAEKRAELRNNVLKGKVFGSLAIAAVGCYSLDLLVASVVGMISPSTMDSFNELMANATSGDALVSFLTIVVLAPIAEEIAFRGIIFRMLSKRTTPVVTIIISAILFGIFHLNLMQAIYVIPLGLLLGYVAYKYQSVIPCIFIHMVNNFMPTVVGMLPEALQAVWVFVIVFVVCAAALFVTCKKSCSFRDSLFQKPVL